MGFEVICLWLKIARAENKKIWFISKFVDQIFSQSISRDRKERQLGPQASAGYPLSINSLFAFRKAQRGCGKKLRRNNRTLRQS
jgi:hypothetical protein